ncbi:STAS domain-containing protein [Leptospira wolffii]|uniref:STAS domain-containing protein n=1 Tax=Leptospira wolffii TaxID=409998 RepID=UPI0002EBAF77|nr:STAS domain-containing protein [Leptospira wolffii]EPG67526.1 hypothetical protein LEP1GSC061_0324 [Leptospira wolffii serovar Khorat str. Khorat-H2]
MEIRTSKLGKIAKVAPGGVLDSYASFDLVRFIKAKWEEGDRLFLLDASGIEYLEEEGISALNELRVFFDKHGGNIAFYRWNEENRLVLGLFGLDQAQGFFSEEKEAEVWLSSLKVEDLRTKPEPSYQSISQLRKTKPVQFYASSVPKAPDSDVYVPELSSVPLSESGREDSSKETERLKSNSLEASVEREKAVFQEKILFCESCRSRLRIKSIGRHQCPSCGIQFDVSRTGGVRYLEKLLD